VRINRRSAGDSSCGGKREVSKKGNLDRTAVDNVHWKEKTGLARTVSTTMLLMLGVRELSHWEDTK